LNLKANLEIRGNYIERSPVFSPAHSLAVSFQCNPPMVDTLGKSHGNIRMPTNEKSEDRIIVLEGENGSLN
jgi:hypothetical protein